MNETERIDLLTRVLARPGDAGAGVDLGIGDDAAVLDGARATGRLVWTIDEQVEGVHFRREWLPYRDIGWRSAMAAASDVAAMGAVPWCSLAAWVLPGNVDPAAIEEIGQGQREAAEALHAPVVGGNLSRGPVLSIATTWLGTCEHAILRSGARAGDGVWLAGRVGLAAAGLQALTRGLADRPALAEAVAAWRRPRALVVEGRAMAVVARAAIDVSDGLARDAGQVARASGVGLALDEEALLADPALTGAAAALGESALGLALHGGEDYALLVASGVPIPGFRRIGEVVSGRGLVLRRAGGEPASAIAIAIEELGFDHFPRSPSST